MQDDNDLSDEPTTDKEHWRLPLMLAFMVVELYIAYWVWGTTGELTGKYLNLFALALGMVVAAIYLGIVFTRRNFLVRLAIDIAATLFVVFGHVIPTHRAEVEQKTEEQARAVRLKAADEASKIKLDAWLTEMKQAGNHGPPGQVPPMLTVEDDGTTVRVQNDSDRGIRIALARVREDSTVPGGWKGCGMYTTDGGGGKYFWIIDSNKSITYVTREPCAPQFRGAPIEYRVGERPPENGWWSDSAFAKPEGREDDGIR